VSSHKQLLGNTQNSRHRYAASTSGNPSFSVLRQLQYLCELTHAGRRVKVPAMTGSQLKALLDYIRALK
ncbi:hypothetical protein, partial [Klebsiella pneumoniae]|uniref:hypothetical protein n=1 Tax=Klebsiella pneumoniae TaxID=573 RepID=UPI001A91F1D5